MVGKSIRKSNRATRYLRAEEVAATRPPILRFDAVLTLEYEITVRKTPFRPPPSPPVPLNTPRLKHLRDIVPTSPFHIFKSKSNLIYRDRQLLQDGILMKISKQISCVIRSIQFQSKLFDLSVESSKLYDLISLIPSQAYAC